MNSKKPLTEENLIHKMIRFILKGKGRQLQQKVKSDPSIAKAVSKFDKAYNELQAAIKKSRKTGYQSCFSGILL